MREVTASTPRPDADRLKVTGVIGREASETSTVVEPPSMTVGEVEFERIPAMLVDITVMGSDCTAFTTNRTSSDVTEWTMESV